MRPKCNHSVLVSDGQEKQSHGGESNAMTKAEVEVLQPQAREHLEPRRQKRQGRTGPWSPQRGHAPADTLVSDFWTLELRGDKFPLGATQAAVPDYCGPGKQVCSVSLASYIPPGLLLYARAIQTMCKECKLRANRTWIGPWL